MPPSILSFPTIFFISSIILNLISNPNHIVDNPSSSPSLIQKASSNDSISFDTELCLRVLQSEPNLVSAKDLYNLSIAIMESGISNSTNTCTHIEMMINQANAETGLKGALQECKLSYDQVVDGFNAAHRFKDDNDYEAPSYELRITSSDYIKNCASALASQKIEDEIIWRGNRVVPIFALSACYIVEYLEDQSTPPPYHN